MIHSSRHFPGEPGADARPWFFALASFLPLGSLANPQGPVVQSGHAAVSTSGAHTQITASHNAVLQWQSFNLAPGQSANFIQPSASSVVWNRILGGNASEIHGSITANGVVVLMNSAGFYFGPSAFVSAAGLIVSTAPATPVETGSSLFWQFNGAPPGVSIVNYGQLQVGSGGSAFLIADHIENRGSISAPNGSIGLAAGREVLLSERPDGRGLSAQVRLPSGSIDQSGKLVADAGAIALQAQVVNHSGVLQANVIRERDGVIELYATDINLGSSGSVPNPTDPPPTTLDVDVNSSFVGASRIEIQATRNITLAAGTTWDLPSSTGSDEPGNQPFARENLNPIRIDVDGDMSGILLGLPKRADIHVAGNLINSRLEGQHLSQSDVTRLRVDRDIRNRNEFTSTPLDREPDFSPFFLDLIYPPSPVRSRALRAASPTTGTLEPSRSRDA